MNKNYFSYGSNMNFQRMIDRGVGFLGRSKGTIADYKLEFNKKSSASPYGFASITPSPGDSVEGVLYELSDPPDGIGRLDRYEGYPNHYERHTVSVTTEFGQQVEAVVYIASPAMIQEGLRPSEEYLNHLLAGKEFLSDNYYQWLLTQSDIKERRGIERNR